VMVARGAQGNPWIFREAKALLETGEAMARPSYAERIEMAREHGRALVALGGDHAVIRMRKHVGWYVSEMPGATHVRTRVNEAITYDELDALLVEYAEYLRSHTPIGAKP
jgi:tRNA-dihydrouridine synthase B